MTNIKFCWWYVRALVAMISFIMWRPTCKCNGWGYKWDFTGSTNTWLHGLVIVVNLLKIFFLYTVRSSWSRRRSWRAFWWWASLVGFCNEPAKEMMRGSTKFSRMWKLCVLFTSEKYVLLKVALATIESDKFFFIHFFGILSMGWSSMGITDSLTFF